MHQIVVAALLLFIAGACARAPSPDIADRSEALPALRVDGNRFVNDGGQTVVLRGVSFSDPDRLESAGHWNREYFQAARDWNANVVRFPVHPGRLRDRGEEEYLRLLDQGVQWATELGMYVIIDWHSIGSLQAERFTRESYETTRQETRHFWETIARRYAGNSTVAFYELFNEPTTDGGRAIEGEIVISGKFWSRLTPEMQEMVRTADARGEFSRHGPSADARPVSALSLARP